ncbi:hypothetical protein ILUMI_23466 [Ignelater luminosus]|uniref:Cyclase n=1 Tax=Ignelater luminosus TaxID=2038154 RepID=A0A8K0G1W2_IGNLU|nr:hypothetical protein ILUMI_23466 [Ignelater luminosus]
MRCFVVFFFIGCYLETISATLTRLEDTVDLTWSFDNDTIYWTNSQPFVFTRKIAEIRRDGVWYAANEFCAGEHGGTHFDAPYHFNKQGWKVAEIPLSRLIVRGVKIDVTEEVELLKDKALLLPEHLEQWEEDNGSIPKNSVLLIKFGWSKYYSNKTEYLGIDQQDNLNFPGLSEAAAEWIVKSRKIVGVGVDTASADAGRDINFPVHRILSAHQIYVLENVKIPAAFPDTGFILYVLPMKIQDGTGAPLRLIAIPHDSDLVPPNLKIVAMSPAVPIYSHIIIILSSVVLLVLYSSSNVPE